MMVRAGRVAPAWGFVLGAMLLFGAVPAWAVENIGITARKLIVIDKLAFANKGAVRLLSLDPRIKKGSGTSTATISATLDVTIEPFNQQPISGAFSVPSGFSVTGGWRVNNASIAKYVNTEAPGGPTQVRVLAVQQNAFFKVSAKGLGDLPLELSRLAFAPFDVQVRLVVMNGPEAMVHCTVFHSDDCALPVIGAGSGRKLQCKNGEPAYDCVFPPPP